VGPQRKTKRNQRANILSATMAEVLLLSLPRAAAVAADRAARKGDPDAVSWLEDLFEPYRNSPIPCFFVRFGAAASRPCQT